MTKQINTPELRFPEFKNEWKLENLGNLADIVRGASPRPIKDSKWFDDNSDIGWLRISDVTQQNGKIKFLQQHLSTEGQKKTRVLYEPHLLLSIAASVGKPVINYVKTGVHDGFLIFMKPKFDLYFMFNWLENFQLKWNKYGQPGSQVNLNSDLVKSQNIYIPYSYEEEEKMGTFFSKLDRQIELEEKKLELLEQQKRGYMQKIFSQGLRFKDEEGNYYKEWDTKQLKDVLEFSNKKTTNENEYPVLTSSRQGLILQSDYYKDGKTFAESNIGYFILPKNYITYRSRSDDGIFKFNLNQIIDVGIISKYYPVFKGINTNQYYLTLHLNYQLKKEYIKYATGTSQLVLSQKNLQNIQTKLPSYEEQTKIANFLSELDKLIEKQSDKVELLKDRKKGLLQKMFV